MSCVEAARGMVIVVPSWMLDPAVCADLTLGDPRVDVAALKDLSKLLIDRGFRRSSFGEARVAKEELDEASAQTGHRDGANAGGTDKPREGHQQVGDQNE